MYVTCKLCFKSATWSLRFDRTKNKLISRGYQIVGNKWFGQYICRHILCEHMADTDVAFKENFKNWMMPGVNMFGLAVDGHLVAQKNSTMTPETYQAKPKAGSSHKNSCNEPQFVRTCPLPPFFPPVLVDHPTFHWETRLSQLYYVTLV